MIVAYRLISLIIGYALGNILPAVPIARHFAGKPIEDIGSGNPGMANVMKNVSKTAGILVLDGDVIKTGLAILICHLCFGRSIGIAAVTYAGIGTVLGHNFPCWRHFRGGKGVAVTCAWLIFGYGLWGIASSLIGAAVVFFTGWLPVGAVVISVVSIPFAFVYRGTETGIILVISCLIMISRNNKGLSEIIKGKIKPHMAIHRRTNCARGDDNADELR